MASRALRVKHLSSNDVGPRPIELAFRSNNDGKRRLDDERPKLVCSGIF